MFTIKNSLLYKTFKVVLTPIGIAGILASAYFLTKEIHEGQEEKKNKSTTAQKAK